MMKAIKDKVFNYVVVKNANIKSEYERYVLEHIEEHNSKRLQHWKILLKLNWHYRIRKKRDPLIYKINRKAPRPEKYPYLKGAESELTNIPSPIQFIKPLLKYDIISFDIFDTLIFRPFTNPKDLFMVVGEKLNFFDFYDIRIKAEQQARELAYVNNGSREITIEDIYVQVERETGIPIDVGVKTEFETELELCFKNPYMYQVFYLLLAQKKRILLISDMYYPHDMLKKLVNSCGYSGFENLFVSCDYRTGKGGNGGLFRIVKQIYGDSLNYCHVGDNYNSDILSAARNGFSTQYYQNVNEIGNKYRATFDGMSELIGSAYGGIINTHLHSGLQKYSAAYEYGFIYGGLYILGYCKWIYEYAKSNGINKILFLARDGDIYSKVFSRFFSEIPCSYVYWSRIPSIRVEAERNRHDFLLRYIRHRLNDVHPMNISSILEMMSLDFLSDKLQEYKLYPNTCLTPDTVTSMENMLIDYWPEVLATYKTESLVVENYLKKVIGDAERVAVVDIGWAGSGPSAIKWLVEEKMKLNCKVDCLLAAGYSFHSTSTTPQIMNNNLHCYIFNQMYNRNLKDVHLKTNKHSNNLFFELFTQATSPTMEHFYEKDGKLELEFGFVEIENYELMQNMHEGILDFATIYYQRFKDNPFMLNISGYDAYIPFRFLVKDLSLIHAVLDNFVITRNLSYDRENYSLETLGEILHSKGL